MAVNEVTKELELKKKLKASFEALNKEKDEKRDVLKELFANNPEELRKRWKAMREEMHEKRIKKNEEDIEQVYWDKLLMREVKKLSAWIHETIEQQKKQFEELIKLVQKADDNYSGESLTTYPLRSEIEDLALSFQREMNSLEEKLKKVKDISPKRYEKLEVIIKETFEEKFEEWEHLNKTPENVKKFRDALIVFQYDLSRLYYRTKNEAINIFEEINNFLSEINKFLPEIN